MLGCRSVARLARDPRLVDIASRWLDAPAIPFKATLFEKSPDANWLVSWHQDTALPMSERHDVAGWGPWSKKSGVTYAHAPARVLERVIALRVHLDDSTADNGPLRVLPGSHILGVLDDTQIHELSQRVPAGAVRCPRRWRHRHAPAARPRIVEGQRLKRRGAYCIWSTRRHSCSNQASRFAPPDLRRRGASPFARKSGSVPIYFRQKCAVNSTSTLKISRRPMSIASRADPGLRVSQRREVGRRAHRAETRADVVDRARPPTRTTTPGRGPWRAAQRSAPESCRNTER